MPKDYKGTRILTSFSPPKHEYFVLHDLIDRQASHSARGAVVG